MRCQSTDFANAYNNGPVKTFITQRCKFTFPAIRYCTVGIEQQMSNTLGLRAQLKLRPVAQ